MDDSELIALISHEQYLDLLDKLEAKTLFITIVQTTVRDETKNEIVQYADRCMELLEMKFVKEWHGTVSWEPAPSYTYKADKAFFQYLREFDSFFLHTLDENGAVIAVRQTSFGGDDIAFLDEKQVPLFYTTTHEGYAAARKDLGIEIIPYKLPESPEGSIPLDIDELRRMMEELGKK